MNAGLYELSTTITSFLTLDANEMGTELFKKRLAYLYEKFLSIDLFHEPLALKNTILFLHPNNHIRMMKKKQERKLYIKTKKEPAEKNQYC